MASVIEYYSKFEVCMVVRFLQAEGVSAWCSKFKDGQTALNDDPQKHSQSKHFTH
jgi:hypothetical protein